MRVLKDLRGQFSNNIDAYGWLVANYWPRLTHRVLTAISPTTADLRDFIVATRALVTLTMSDGDNLQYDEHPNDYLVAGPSGAGCRAWAATFSTDQRARCTQTAAIQGSALDPRRTAQNCRLQMS